jgi:beta-1,4-mannooligosaccharide/beta-1,4-mannosyl-N-acetylglucosamine phosphorylase
MSLRRRGAGPVLDRTDVPDMPPAIIDATSVFNPGAVLAHGRTVLLLRVQTRGRRTYTVPAFSLDGVAFQVARQPVRFDWAGFEPGGEIFHIYDARITPLDDGFAVVTAVDLADGCRLAIWRGTGDPSGEFLGLEQLTCLGWSSFNDTRNGVLFPGKVGGRHLMLERPNRAAVKGGPTTGNSIVLSESDDLQTWREVGPVMAGRFHYWDELIGSGPPPVRTAAGWLHIYHGVATHFHAANIYQAGAVLLDPDDPTRVLARTRDNILEPRELWELVGQVPNVVFPAGMTVSELDAQGLAPDSATLRIYYGAADSAVGLAETTVGKLLEACRQE